MGKKIQRKRLELGLTQLEMAKLLNLNDQTISRWETEESIPNVKHYPSIISFLGTYPFEIEESLGGKCKRYRFTQGLSQKRLAQILKIPLKNIQAIEKKEIRLSITEEAAFIELLKLNNTSLK